MSVLERIFTGVRAVIQLDTQVAELKDQSKEHADKLVQHEMRLVRIETMIEMSERAAARPPRLPRR